MIPVKIKKSIDFLAPYRYISAIHIAVALSFDSAPVYRTRCARYDMLGGFERRQCDVDGVGRRNGKCFIFDEEKLLQPGLFSSHYNTI